MQQPFGSINGLSAQLRKSSDWTNWRHVFLLQVTTHGLEDHVIDKRPLIKRPTIPDIRHQKYAKTANALREARSLLARDDEGIDAYHHQENPIQEKADGEWMMTDLTDAGQKNFNLDYNWYKQKETTYLAQKTSVEKLNKWIFSTVDPEFISTCCQPRDGIWRWYANLEARCGMISSDEKQAIRQEYKEAIKPPRSIRDARAWADKWEMVMAKAKAKGVADAQDCSAWAVDFLKAVSTLMPSWAAAYQIHKKEAISDGSLEFRSLGNDFRQGIAIHHIPKGFGKGAFATYAGEADEEPQDGNQIGDARTVEDQNPARPGAAKPRRGRGGKSSQRDSSRDDRCLACNLPHALAMCYYVFPEKAYHKFKPRKEIQDRVMDSLENDTELQAKVRGMKRARTKSSTPRTIKESSQSTD
jgi:ferredoxin